MLLILVFCGSLYAILALKNIQLKKFETEFSYNPSCFKIVIEDNKLAACKKSEISRKKLEMFFITKFDIFMNYQ